MMNASSKGPEVTDTAHVELDQVLDCTVDELIALVRPMSANYCELYARAILGRTGGPSFEQLMMRIVQTACPKDGIIRPCHRTPITLPFATCFPISPKEMMSWGGSFFLL